jgi:hypothetical protein
MVDDWGNPTEEKSIEIAHTGSVLEFLGALLWL